MTIETLLALAPDSTTAQRAQFLAEPSVWQAVSIFENSVSATTSTSEASFQTSFDFEKKTGRCGCFSTARPCVHQLGLALFFLRKQSDGQSENNDFIEKNNATEKRNEAAEQKLAALESGFADLKNWLADAARQGLATVVSQPQPFENIAARAVDGKLAGIGRQLRLMHEITTAAPDWSEKMLDRLADFHLAAQAFDRRADLPDDLVFDLLQLTGATLKKDFIQQIGSAVHDRWAVFGQTLEREEALLARKTWLFGAKTGRFALILEFAFGGQPFSEEWFLGGVYEGELSFYPSAWPQRAVVKKLEATDRRLAQLPAATDFDALSAQFSEALSRQIWLAELPVCLAAVLPIYRNGVFFLLNSENFNMKLNCLESVGWKLMAVSGGGRIPVFGLWNGESLTPLTASGDGKLVQLNELESPVFHFKFDGEAE